MGPILNEQLFFVVEKEQNEEEDINYMEKDSLWVIDGDLIRPSTNLSIRHKMSPGIYKVDISKDIGIYCKKINITSDELYYFSHSKIPDLLNQIKLFWKKAEAYKNNNLIHKRGILLEGYPGSGKTSIISLLCDDIISKGGIVFNVTSPSNLSVYTSFVKNSFRSIEPETPIITIIEDIDKYDDSDVLLDFLDGKSQIEHHLVIATTNDTTRIPDSFLRPSRIDLKIEIPLPSDKVRREYFTNKKVSENLIEELVKNTNNCSLADLKEIYISVFLLDYSIDEAIKKVKLPQNKKEYNSNTLKTTKLAI